MAEIPTACLDQHGQNVLNAAHTCAFVILQGELTPVCSAWVSAKMAACGIGAISP